MIRQELMDNIQELKNALDVAINGNVPEYEKVGWIKVAHQTATKIETMVAEELEAQRQEQSEYILDGELASDPVENSGFIEFKEYCAANNLKPSHGKVLNDYCKNKEVESCQTNGTQI